MTQKATVTSGTLLELSSNGLFTGQVLHCGLAMEFVRYRHCAKAISDILQETWKEMTILSFYFEYLDVWLVILGEGLPNRLRSTFLCKFPRPLDWIRKLNKSKTKGLAIGSASPFSE
jgi:hypothetical protein